MDDDADLIKRLGALAGSTADIQPRPALSDRVMAAVFDENGDSFSRISLATEDIEPDARISEAVMSRVDQEGVVAARTDEPALSSGLAVFSRIAAATSKIEPATAFTDAVMAKLPKVRAGLGEGLLRSARMSLLVAGFAAAASVFFSWYTEESQDEQVAVALIAEDTE